MSNETLFFVFGLALTAAALVVSFAGLRSRHFPPSGLVLGGVVAMFAVLVLGTAVFGVANARDEAEHREAEQAEEAAAEEARRRPSSRRPALARRRGPERRCSSPQIPRRSSSTRPSSPASQAR